MHAKSLEFERKLNSESEWQDRKDGYITDHFRFLGFRRPEDFMKIRIYDFLNLDMVDNNRAEEMIVYLSDFLYPHRERYSGYPDSGTNEAVMNWLSDNPDLSEALLRDLICAEQLCLEDMLYIFDCISMSFYHSSEYNSRKYRYGHISEIEYPFCNYGC